VSTRTDCTRNDLLIAALLVAGREQRRLRGLPEAPLRLLLPQNLRPLLQLGPCLQNLVSGIPAVFQALDCRELVPAARQVATATRGGRNLDVGLETLIQVGPLANLPFPRVTRAELVKFDLREDCFSLSALVSTVRVPERFPAHDKTGEVRVWLRGGLLRQPGLGLVTVIRGESAEVALEYLADYLSHADAQALLDGVFRVLEDTVNGVARRLDC
jgi:hypothetical protein